VDFPTPSKKEWVLTKEAFDRFLARLDMDRDKAGEKYESVRLKLLKYFQWRGSDSCDMEADETINRVARRIEEGENVYNLNAYIYGVARMVDAEARRLRIRKYELDEASGLEVAPIEEEDPEVVERRRCFERCLGYLTDEERETITEYYQFEKGRKIEHRRKLADRFGISLNALRIKAHRKRINLEACVRECLSPPCS
jgi:DNA-directed RNA polymerase specialized sigma24 family protein